MFALVFTVPLNLTLPVVFRDGFALALARSPAGGWARIAGCTAGLLAASGFGLWVVALIVGTAT